MKKICLQVKTETTRKGQKVIVTREAQLDGCGLSFSGLASFLEDFENVNKLLKSAAKNENIFTEFEVTTYEYTVDEKGFYKDMKRDTFRRWYFIGYPAIDYCEQDNGVKGIYLQPDTKYTPEHHDMIYEYTLKSITA